MSKKCTTRINDILPIIGDNVDYQEADSYNCTDIYERLDISREESLADFYIHYTTCKRIIIEEGKKNKTIEKATYQIENTMKILKEKGLGVNYIAIVYDQMTKFDSRNYSCRPDNTLWLKLVGKSKPVEIDGLKLHCFRKSEIQKARKNRNLR